MTQDRSPWQLTGLVIGWVLVALGSLGTLLGLVMILPSATGGQDPHGYGSIFSFMILVLSSLFLLTGLLGVLPKRAALWLSRIAAVVVALVLALLIWANQP